MAQTQTIQQTKASVTVSAAQNIKITPKILTVKDTEYSHALTDNLKSVSIRCRENAELKFAFVEGESSTNYSSIPRGAERALTNLDFVSKTLYIQSNVDSVTVEILELY